MNGLNRSGLLFLCVYGAGNSAVYGTLDGLRTFLARESGEPDGPALEQALGSTITWAENAKAGAVSACWNVQWVIVVDPREDHEHLIEMQDWTAYQRLDPHAAR